MNLFQVLLHEFLARHLLRVVDFLAKSYEVHAGFGSIVVLLIAHLIDALVTHITRLRVRVAHIK